MSSSLEKKTEQDVIDWWVKHGGMHCKLNLLGRRGWPDRLFLPYGGKPVFIEFKRVNEQSRKLQDHIHGQLRKRGYEVNVCDSLGVATSILART